MQFVVLLTICSVTLGTFSTLHGAPGVIKFIPEMLSAVVAGYVVIVGMRDRFRLIQPKYWIIFGALLFGVICGVIANGVGSGPIIAGMRYYLRALPFFFLPAVMLFSERQVKQQLMFLLAMCMIQVPFSGYQRWLEELNQKFTGDRVVGTLNESATVTMLVVAGALIVLGFFMKGRIGKVKAAILFLLLLVPTTLNETKITIFIVPLGLFITLMLGAKEGQRLKVAGVALMLLVTLGSLFAPVYNYFQRNNPYPHSIGLDLFTDPKKNYLQARHAGVGATKEVGRMDALEIPVQYLSRDPIQLAFGLGIGNASESSLGTQFSGRYLDLFQNVTIISFTVFLLELGLIGTLMLFVLYWVLFRDAVTVARNDNSLYGAIATGWAGVVAIVVLGNFYKVLMPWESISFLFWYFSGMIAARRMQLSLEAHSVAKVDRSADIRTPAPIKGPLLPT